MTSPPIRRLPLPALRRALDDPEPVTGFGARSPVDGLARRAVGFWDVLAQSVAAVAPTGVAVGFPVLVLTQAGGSAVAAAILGIAATLLVAMSISEFARRLAVTGSLYTYVTKALGPDAGFLTSLGLQLGYGFISVFCLASSLEYLRLAWEQAVGNSPPRWLLVALVLILGTAVVTLIVRGIRLTLRILLVVEATTATVVLILVVLVLARLGGSLGWSTLHLANANPTNLGAGAAIVITAFVGFESSAATGAEAKRPFRDIPRALIWTVVGVGVLYFLAATAQVLAFKSLHIDPASSSPVNQIAAAEGVAWIGIVLDLSVAVSFFACATASTTALARVLFSLGREGVLPHQIGRTHPSLRTPVAAALVTVPIVALLPAATIACGASLSWMVETSLVVATAGYLLAYLLVASATPVFLWRLGELTLRPVLIAAAATLTLAGVIGFYLTDQWTDRSRAGILLFAGWLAVGTLLYLIRLRIDPRVRARLGMYDEPVAADVLGGAPLSASVDSSEPS